ncbi:MAG: hypothetical protein ACO3A2_06140 [Bdellovibrionia bacterium]
MPQITLNPKSEERRVKKRAVFSVTKSLILWLMLISGIVVATYQIRSHGPEMNYSIHSS